MKFILNIIFVFVSASSFAQEWRDSLAVAREAYKNKEYPKAVKYYESAQKKAPENIDLSDELAQSAYKAREFEKAEKIYQQNAGSKNSNIDKAANAHNIGNARMKRKDYQGAIESYKNSLRLNPNDDRTRYNLSEAIRQLKNQQEQNKKNQPQNQNEEKKEQDQQDQQDQQGDKNEQNQGEQKPGDQQNGEQGQPKKSAGQGNPGDSKSKLPNKTADRMLDKLMKEEAETKRKLNSGQGGNHSPKSGKDW